VLAVDHLVSLIQKTLWPIKERTITELKLSSNDIDELVSDTVSVTAVNKEIGSQLVIASNPLNNTLLISSFSFPHYLGHSILNIQSQHKLYSYCFFICFASKSKNMLNNIKQLP